jgi:hypothetical protein
MEGFEKNLNDFLQTIARSRGNLRDVQTQHIPSCARLWYLPTGCVRVAKLVYKREKKNKS